MYATRPAIALVALVLLAEAAPGQELSPQPGLLSDVVTVTVVRLSGVMADRRMTELENVTTEQGEGIIALRAAIAGNTKVRQALADAGVPDVNAIVGAQFRTGGNLTVYVR